MPRRKHIKHNAVAMIRIYVYRMNYDGTHRITHTETHDTIESVNARIPTLRAAHDPYNHNAYRPTAVMKNRHHGMDIPLHIHAPYHHDTSYMRIEPILLHECRDDPALRDELCARAEPYYPRHAYPLPLNGPQFPTP